MMLATDKQAYCCEMCVKSHQFLSKMANNRPLRTNWRAEMAANRSSWRRQAQPYFQPATHRGREIGLRSRLSVVRKARHVHRAWGEPGRFASPERKVRFGASADAKFANAAHTIGRRILSDALPTRTKHLSRESRNSRCLHALFHTTPIVAAGVIFTTIEIAAPLSIDRR